MKYSCIRLHDVLKILQQKKVYRETQHSSRRKYQSLAERHSIPFEESIWVWHYYKPELMTVSQKGLGKPGCRKYIQRQNRS